MTIRTEKLHQCEECGEVWDADEFAASSECKDCSPVPRAEYTNDAEHFAAIARRQWRGVKFDPKKQSGTVDWGSLGYMTFHESANDGAVCVYLGAIRFKDRATSVVGALNKIHRILTNTGL
jgi:hypothetical protein